MTSNNHPQRCFLVGCPRSGTTLLQSLIAAHSQVISFPETNFYLYLNPSRTILQKLKIIGSRRIRPLPIEFLCQTGHQELMYLIPKIAVFKWQYVQAYINILDSIAKSHNKNCWLEKSPLHVHYVNLIERHFPNAKIIHIVRNGADVVASLYDVAHNYPRKWDKNLKTIDGCIDEWNRAIDATRKHMHKPNQLIVRYEKLVLHADQEMRRVFQFLGLPMEKDVLERQKEVTDSLIGDQEQWKSNVKLGVKQDTAGKFEKLFDDKQRKYILSHLRDINVIDLPCS